MSGMSGHLSGLIVLGLGSVLPLLVEMGLDMLKAI